MEAACAQHGAITRGCTQEERLCQQDSRSHQQAGRYLSRTRLETILRVMDRVGLVPAGQCCDMLAVLGETIRMDSRARQITEVYVVMNKRYSVIQTTNGSSICYSQIRACCPKVISRLFR